MQFLENLPWYGYVIFAVAIGSYVYKYFAKAKESYDEEKPDAKFRKSPNSSLNNEQLFSLALYTPIAEWWKANTNTLQYRDAKTIKPYLEGWGMETPDGYWNLTEYFMKDGRRWYFNFIYHMIQNDPESKWDALMAEQFGTNERATRYFELLKTGKTLEKLKQKGIFTFDSDLDLGVAGYDAAMLVGQARIAYTGNIISEEEAWKVIQFARELAVKSFSNWEDFAKSFALGFDLDMRADYNEYKEEVFHIFKQVMDKPDSPWNTINWPQ